MNGPHAKHPTAADLAAFAAGKSGEAEAGPIALHLQSCPDCHRAAFEALYHDLKQERGLSK
jgi:hypothetical protein